MKKNKKLLENNTFLINACVCILVVLVMCYFGINTSVRKTYSADTGSNCAGTEYIGQNGPICVETNNLQGIYYFNDYMSIDSVFPTNNSEYTMALNFEYSGISYAGLKFKKASNYFYYIYFLKQNQDAVLMYAFSTSNPNGEKITIDGVDYYRVVEYSSVGDDFIGPILPYITFETSQEVSSEFYNWFSRNATPNNSCYYVSSLGKFTWGNISSLGEAMPQYDSKESCETKCYYNNKTGQFSWTDDYEYGYLKEDFTTKDSCEYKCYYNDSTGKFSWTNDASVGSLYAAITSQSACESISSYYLNLNVDYNNVTGISMCTNRSNVDGSCIEWSTPADKITFNTITGNEYKLGTDDYKVMLRDTAGTYYVLDHWLISGRDFGSGETVATYDIKVDGTLSFGDGNPIGYSLTAKLVEAEVVVHYDAKGGELNKEYDTVGNFDTGSVILPAATRDGYTFKGWEDVNGNNVGRSGFTFDINDDAWPDDYYEQVTLYAIWAKNYTVIFDATGGVSDKTSEIISSGNSVTTPSATRPGYIFKGWYDGSKTTEVGIMYPVTQDVTFYAVWEPAIYTVFFDANGGVTSTTSVVVDIGDSITLPATTRDGYTFVGWNTKSDGTGTHAGIAYNDYTPESNLTLYAQWNENLKVTVSTPFILDEANKRIRVPAGTTKDNFLNTVVVATGYAKSVDIKTIDNVDMVYTGGELKIYDSSTNLAASYTVVVVGDVTGDGKVDAMDYIVVYRHLSTKYTDNLTGALFAAGDYDNSGKIDAMDYVDIYNYLKSKG